LFVYWGIFLILATGAMLSQDRGVVRARFALILLGSLPVALLIGLRWKIGPDWSAYLDIFSYTKLFSLGQAIGHQDPGFILLNLGLHQLDAPFWVMNLICGTVFVAGLTAFARRQPNPWLAFLVAFPYLVIVVAMSGDRQSLALGLLFFALNAFERGQLFRFVLLVLIAALFHGSILLILPLGMLSYTRNSLQRALLLLAAAVLAYYFFSHVFGTYARRYSSEKIQSTGVIYRLGMNAGAAVIFLAFKRRFALEEHLAKLWRNMSLCTLALIALLAVIPSSTAVDRFLLYLFPLQFMVLSRVPTALSHSRQAAGQLTLLVIAYAAAVQLVFLQFGTYSSYYIPYRTIFQR
jgi:hypothetical protein